MTSSTSGLNPERFYRWHHVAQPTARLASRIRAIVLLQQPKSDRLLSKSIPFMVRQAHHERNDLLAVRPESLTCRSS
jgi:hypothetical protein